MYTEEQLNNRAVYLVKDALKNCLINSIGPLEPKSDIEIQAWIIALNEIRNDLLDHLVQMPQTSGVVLKP